MITFNTRTSHGLPERQRILYRISAPAQPIFGVTLSNNSVPSKFKAYWTIEAEEDLKKMFGDIRGTPPKSPEESNRLFFMVEKFNELYPVGSLVHLDVSRIMYGSLSDDYDKNVRAVKVLSEAVVLLNKSAVGFLTSESQDDGDFYFVDDLIEYHTIVEAIGATPKEKRSL